MKKFLVVIFFLILWGEISGQAKEITETEYNGIVDSARNKHSTTSHRANSKFVGYDDGKVYLTTEWQRSFLTPDKKYYKNIRTLRGETKKLEQIQIGKSIYCRENDAKWTRSQRTCESAFFSAASKIESTKFSSEETTLKDENVRVFEQYFTYSSYSNTSVKFFTRRKSWINKDGFLLKEEVENGTVGAAMPNKEVIEFEYNPKDLKIAAPIK